MNSTNSLRYSVTRIKDDRRADISIRLDDECRNGHQDFAITATIYERRRDNTNLWRAGSSGACHEDILEIAPEFAPFVRLHLCDYLGVPMHAAANGFYHLRSGFNNTKPDDPAFPAEYCEYYRVSPEQFAELNKSETELQFKIALQSLGILDQWKTEADAAIKELEQLTGSTFVVDSIRSQYTAPTLEEIAAENEKIASGYYSDEQKAARRKAKENEIIDRLYAELVAEKEKAQLEFDVKVEVLEIGGPAALKACIFYTHTKTLAFNWWNYDQISETEANRIIGELHLPDGVKAEISKRIA